MNNTHSLKPGDIIEFPGYARRRTPEVIVIRRTSEKSVWFSVFFKDEFDDYQFRKAWYSMAAYIERRNGKIIRAEDV